MGCIVLVRWVLDLRCGLAGVVWYPYAGFSLHTTPPLVRWVLVLRCGWAGVMWYPYAGFSLHTTPPQLNHNVTPTPIEPEQYNPWNNSSNKSQAPEDGCINIQNMLSSK